MLPLIFWWNPKRYHTEWGFTICYDFTKILCLLMIKKHTNPWHNMQVCIHRGFINDQSSSNCNTTYFVNHHTDYTHKYSGVDSKKMLQFFNDNDVYVVNGDQVFQTVCWNCFGHELCSLSAEIFLYSYEAGFIENF